MTSQVVEERQVEDIESVRSIALRQIEIVKEHKRKIKAFREQKKSILDNDQELSQAQARAEEYLDEIKKARAKVKERPEFAEVALKEKREKEDMKDVVAVLGGHLQNYSRITGTNFIEDQDGNQMKIKHKVSLQTGQMKLF